MKEQMDMKIRRRRVRGGVIPEKKMRNELNGSEAAVERRSIDDGSIGLINSRNRGKKKVNMDQG